MSYILDALRRAEADRERERGQVPGLHTHPSSGGETASSAGPRRWLPWAAGGVLLLAGIGVGSWWASAPPEAAPVPPPAAVPPPPVATAPAMPHAVSAPAPQPAASASPYLPPAPPPAAVVAAPPPPAALVAEAPIPRLAELPDSLRRELPALAVSGSVYSEDPAGRFVIINGEVQREGAKLGAELVLEQIRQRELVMRFKGQRYRMPV